MNRSTVEPVEGQTNTELVADLRGDSDNGGLTFYRASHAILHRGTIIVASTGTHRLVVLDASGRLIKTVGREGDGPGEFRQLTWVGAYRADSIIAFDAAQGRISVFTSDIRFARGHSLASGDPSGRTRRILAGVFHDGTLLAREAIVEQAGGRDSLYRDSVKFVRLTPEGRAMAAFGTFPGSEQIAVMAGGGVFVDDAPFGKRTAVATFGNYLMIGAGNAFEVRVYDSTNALRSVVRKEHVPVRLTDADQRWYKERRLRMVEGTIFESLIQQVLQRTPFPEHAADHGPVYVDDAGNVWVADGAVPRANQYYVFGPDGLLRAAVSLPQGLTVYQVGFDVVLGSNVDEEGIEHLLLYRLANPLLDLLRR